MLFNAAAAAKIQTSQISMHLPDTWRTTLFCQLDALYDAEEWDETDSVIDGGSLWTFLRMILRFGPKGRPGLGISGSGNLIAAWQHGKDSVTLEMFPGDFAKWSAVVHRDGELDYGAGVSPVHLLSEKLTSYVNDQWYSEANGDPEKA